jgi:hypothetical protein
VNGSVRLAVANKDPSDPDSRVAHRGRGTLPAPAAADWERSTLADRADQVGQAVRAESISGPAARTDPSSVPAAAHSSAANRNRILRSATLAGTLDVAERRLSEGMAVQSHTAVAELREAAEMLRLGIAARPFPGR